MSIEYYGLLKRYFKPSTCLHLLIIVIRQRFCSGGTYCEYDNGYIIFHPIPSLPTTVMDMVIFRTIFFELLVFFTFTLLTLHFAY